jgi:hypothetical protein
MKTILATSPEDKDKEIARLRRRNAYLQRQLDVYQGEVRERSNREQRDAARKYGNGFAGCNND